MNKIYKLCLLPALMLVGVTAAMSQEYNSARVANVGIVGYGLKIEPAFAPKATLLAGVTVETNSFEAGKYARYAQRYLGVRVSMVSSRESKIVDSYVAMVPEDGYLATSQMQGMDGTSSRIEELSSSVEAFSVEQSTAQPLSPEEGAAKAADRIFEIRKLRRDIISGELGEGFYGAGMAAALESLKQEELACVELFMGRSRSVRQSYSQKIALQGTTPRYMLWRFSGEAGIVPVSDLSAEPITLQITPSGAEKMTSPAADPKWVLKRFIVADDAQCELFVGSDKLTQTVMPLYEFGYEVLLPLVQK